MPDTENGRVTLAVIVTKLNLLIASVDELKAGYKVDHDEIMSMKTKIEDFDYLKRAALGYAVALIISLAVAVVALARTGAP